MLKGTTKNGEMKNVQVNEEGKLIIEAANSEEAPLPVKVVGNGDEKESTLNSSILTIGTEATTISIGKKVTNIMVANYSETADITLKIAENQYQIGAGVATELPINTIVENIDITSLEADTKVQLIVKGVE